MDNPLIKQQEEYDKIASLESLINSNSDPRELKRAIAVKMAVEGYTDQMITQVGVFCINPPKGGISRFIAFS
jgi:hypothetical protein